ncbi:MAG: hypothetical protein RLZZ165_529 [Bacteroidota bacterium]|jgi:DNA repair protein RadC
MTTHVKPPIREWAPEDRPREKLMQRGFDALSDSELLATLIATGTQKMSAIELGRHMIKEFGGLRNLSQATVAELQTIPGVGLAKAASIAAGFELARRKLAMDHYQTSFQNSSDIARYLIPKLGDLKVEVFFVLCLDRKNNLISESEIHRGGVSQVNVDSRLVFKEAITKLASGIVVCHNHPSGSITPSKSDDELTLHLVQASQIMEIPLIDHIIVARKNWYSYADHGRIREMKARG